MTVTTMAVSLLPLLWSDGAGSEIMRRVAAPMLGGLVTSAFLTLEVLPVLYTIWRQRQLRRALALGVPISLIVGPKKSDKRRRFLPGSFVVMSEGGSRRPAPGDTNPEDDDASHGDREGDQEQRGRKAAEREAAQ